MRYVNLIIFILSIFHIQSSELFGTNSIKILTIDALDSVSLNISEGVIVDGYVNIPIYIDSDDDINSLDFSLTFNIEKLSYHSIIDHTGHIQYTDYYNPNDYTLRFTSNSFTLYGINKKIVSVRFKVIATCIETTDFFSMISYLNGDLCSTKLPQAKICTSTSTNDKEYSAIKVFPNPADDQIRIITPDQAVLSVMSSDGTLKIFEEMIPANELFTIQTHTFPTGIYYFNVKMKHKNIIRKIVIE